MNSVVHWIRNWVSRDAAEDRDFRLIWLGQSVSMAGSWVTLVALPLTAAAVLAASPLEMALLAAVQTIPHLLFGIPAGVLADRLNKRAVLLTTELGRALLLASIPAAAILGVLSLAQLYAVGFLTTTLAAAFEATFSAYIVSLVPSKRIPSANARIEASRGFAQLAFPSIGGALAQLVTAPGAVVVDAVSYVVSAITLLLLRGREVSAGAVAAATSPERLRDALRLAIRNRTLATLLLSSAVLLVARMAMHSVFYWFLVNELQLSGFEIGLTVSAFAPGQIAGSILAPWLAARAGAGSALAWSMAGFAASIALIALLNHPEPLTFAVLLSANMLAGLSNGIYGVTLASVRQLATPPSMQGRVAGVMQTTGRAAMTVGLLGGGVLAQAFGVHPVMWLAALVALSAAPIAAFSEFQRAPLARPQPLGVPHE